MAINIAPKSLDTELSELMRDVTSGKAQLPEFQRSWTWDDGRMYFGEPFTRISYGCDYAPGMRE